MDSQGDFSPPTPTPRQRLSGVPRPISLQPPGMALGAGVGAGAGAGSRSSYHYRFADFDEESFSEQAGVSPEQAKRALRAHLADTERRMAEAGRLGTALVQQQKELAEKLQEVENLQAESELSPELKKKLSELEKEYDDVARETARAFLPKQRIPSNESTGSPDVKSSRRSLSPVKYESHASGSPSKLSVSNRKQRNQATNRVHDIEFAAEISTSLISQVRGLQALLAEREEELRDTKQDVARLEDATDSLRDRIKELDESEHRYKEENWNLETRIHDLEAAQREAADNDKKVAQQLAILQSTKNKTQRELDELKGAHARLVDEHAAGVKQHDIELGTAKRNMAMADSEKTALNKKIDELAAQNQELARAVSIQQRSRAGGSESVSLTSDEEFDTAADHVTPEQSPPASPVKGTPRHSVLESETLKTSLLHAQRSLQSFRANFHREKTEKLELRRMLQDARDELERMRADPNLSAAGSSAGKRPRKDGRETQKLRSAQLGGPRSGRTDFFMVESNDPDWEEMQDEVSPSGVRLQSAGTPGESSDQFDTANEGQQSDASFATAKDASEETATDFHTGVEDLSSGEDDMTETEHDTIRRRMLRSRGTTPVVIALDDSTDAIADADADPANQSTASTSDDDELYNVPRTPTGPQSSSGSSGRMRLRVSRSSLASRRLRHMSSSEDAGAGIRTSPFSTATSPAGGARVDSANSTPRALGPQQSLFAELGELDEESDEELGSEGTPGRMRSPRSLASLSFAGTTTSGSSKSRMHSPLNRSVFSAKVVMVDRATLTDAVTILPWTEEDEEEETTRIFRGPEAADDSDAETETEGEARDLRPLSFLSDATNDTDMDEKLAQFPAPPTSPPRIGAILPPIVLPPPGRQGIIVAARSRELSPGVDFEPALAQAPAPVLELTISELHSVLIQPMSEPEPVAPEPAIFSLSYIKAEHVTPKMEPVPEPPVFSFSSVLTEHTTPKMEPAPEPPVFSLSSVLTEHTTPKMEPLPEPPALSFSDILTEHTTPMIEPVPEPPVLSLSQMLAAQVAPIATPVPDPEPLSFSKFLSEHVSPKMEPIPEPTKLPIFTTSELWSMAISPVELPPPILPVPVPVAIPKQIEDTKEVKDIPVLSLSSLQVQHVEPVAELAPAPAPIEPFSFAKIQTQHIRPITPPEPPVVSPPQLSMSSVQGEQVVPIVIPEEPAPAMTLSTIATQDIEPIVEDVPIQETVLDVAVIPVTECASSATQTDEWLPDKRESSGEADVGAVAVVATSAVGVDAAAGTATSVFDDAIDVNASEDPWSPKRNAFIIPRDAEDADSLEASPVEPQEPRTPNKFTLDSLLGGWSKNRSPPTPVIAEDETRQSPNVRPLPETPESQRPFKEISINSATGTMHTILHHSATESAIVTTSRVAESEQTIEGLDMTPRATGKLVADNHSLRRPSRSASQDSIGSSVRRGRLGDVTRAELGAVSLASTQRSGSSGELALPPLPANHREVIEAARSGSAGGTGATATATHNLVPGPTVWQVRTPTGALSREPSVATRGGTPTPRAATRTAMNADMRPPSRPASRTNGVNATAGALTVAVAPANGTISRQTSMSSFASEVDARFGIHDSNDVFGHGYGRHTDPRMIQAITQTMIGEYLWKYTRKPGRSGLSENRHRRYFWIHPYTRMLYWSDQGPTAGSRVEQRAKSVVIEGVRVVTDDNPMPPGLHRKSLVVISPGRTIKFTCPTGHRHEIWFNALSFLLLRTDEPVEDENMLSSGNHITREDVDEFNPSFGQRPAANSQARRRPPVSLSSYNSRTTRNESPAFGMTMNTQPTLTPTPKKNKSALMATPRSVTGSNSRNRLGRIGGYWRSSQSLSAQFNSLRSRSTQRQPGNGIHDNNIYEASEVTDSAEELRVMYEAQDREADRLENVRACCDGKHDVGTLSRGSRRHRHSHHHVASATTTPTSVRHRP